MCNVAKCEINPSGQEDIQVEVYDSFGPLESLQSEWDEFMESLDCEIFLTYDWCRIWWKYYGTGQELRVFIFKHQDKIVALIPMFSEKIRLGPVFIRAVKIMGTDFTISTVSIPIKQQFMREVLQKFRDTLFKNFNLDVVCFGPLSGTYKGYDELLKYFHEFCNNKYHIRSISNKVQTYFILDENREEYLHSLPKKRQRAIKNKYRILREILKEDVCPIVSRFATDQDCRPIFNRFYEMHQEHWQKTGKAGHFGDWPQSKEFHLEVAMAQSKHNRLRLLEVKAGANNLGYKYAYKFGDKYVEYLDARSDAKELSRAGLGNIVFCEQLKKALGEGVIYIDSLCGKYEHKLRMGGKLFPANNIFIYSRGLWPSIKVRAFCGLAWLLHMVYYNIWFRRIAPRLPFKRRPLWKLWIRTHMFK